MLAHPQHDVPISQVSVLINLLGEIGTDGLDSWGQAKRQLYCEAFAVQQALPLWQEACPGNDAPALLLEEVINIISDDFDEATSNSLAYKQSRKLQSASPPPKWPITELFDAAAALLATAQWAAQFKTPVAYKFDPVCTDNSRVYPEDRPCTYRVSIAYANGLAWKEGASKEKRREFWQWWIMEAIPEAFRRFPPAGAAPA
jgi:hypothetical protein